MTEVDFAKAFIAQLSSRPIRIPPDYVEDARKLPARPPTTLPKLPRPMTKRPKLSSSTSPTSSSEPTATLHLKTLRPPHSINETHVLPLSTTFAYIKQQLSSSTTVPFDKLRFLQKGKIVGDSKTLGDLVTGEGGEVMVNVMLMGGAVVKRKEVETEEVASVPVKKVEVEEGEGEKGDVEMKDDGGEGKVEEVKDGGEEEEVKGEKVLDGEGFWRELKVFIVGKVGEEKADDVLGTFRGAWESKKSAP